MKPLLFFCVERLVELGGAFVKNKTKKRRREDVVWRRLTASTHTHTHRWLMAVLLLLLLVLPCVVGSHFGDLYWPRSVCRYFFVDVDIHGALPRGCRFKRPRFFFSLTWIFFLSLSLSLTVGRGLQPITRPFTINATAQTGEKPPFPVKKQRKKKKQRRGRRLIGPSIGLFAAPSG